MIQLKKISKKIPVQTLIFGLTLFLQAESVFASGVNVQYFVPGASLKYPVTESALADRPLGDSVADSYRRYLLSVSYNYDNDPLVVLNSNQDQRTDTLIQNIQTVDLMAGIEWNATSSLNLSLPINTVQKSKDVRESALGDMRVFSKFYLSKERNALNFALIPEIRLPTGNSALFVSDSTLGVGMLFAVEHDFNGFASAAVNVGYRYASGAFFQDIDYRQRVPMSLGLNIPLTSRWALNGETSGSLVLPVNHSQNPSEVYGGLRFQAAQDVTLSAGASRGSFNGFGSSDFRILAGLKYTPFSSNAAPAQIVQVAPIPVAPVLTPKPVARVVFTPTQLDIREEVKFKHDSDILLPSAKNLLDEVAEVLKKHQSDFKRISIEGHCNDLGTDEYNLKLSSARAASVREYLSSRGLKNETLVPIGYGKRRPKQIPGVSHDSWLAANRRVEFKIVK